MRLRILLATAATAATLVCLAGCTSELPVAIPTPFVTTTSTPVASPTTTAPPTPTITKPPPTKPTKPTLDQLVVSANGIGPLLIGEPIKPEPAGLALVRFNSNHCQRPGEPGNAGWESTYSEPSFSLDTTPSAATGTIRTMLVTSTKPSTGTGIRIGSTLAQLKTAYGRFDQVIKRPSTDLYVVRGTHGQLVFEVARQTTYGDNNTPYWPANQVDRVQYLSVWRLSDTPSAFSGTDGGPGSCA